MWIPVKSHNYRISVLISCATIHPEFGKFSDKSKEICYRGCAKLGAGLGKKLHSLSRNTDSGDTGQVVNIIRTKESRKLVGDI